MDNTKIRILKCLDCEASSGTIGEKKSVCLHRYSIMLGKDSYNRRSKWTIGKPSGNFSSGEQFFQNSQIQWCVLGKSDHSLNQTLNGRPNYSGSRTPSNTENRIELMENQLNSSGQISQHSQHWRFFTEFMRFGEFPHWTGTIQWSNFFYVHIHWHGHLQHRLWSCLYLDIWQSSTICIKICERALGIHWPGNEEKWFRGCDYKPEGR